MKKKKKKKTAANFSIKAKSLEAIIRGRVPAKRSAWSWVLRQGSQGVSTVWPRINHWYSKQNFQAKTPFQEKFIEECPDINAVDNKFSSLSSRRLKALWNSKLESWSYPPGEAKRKAGKAVLKSQYNWGKTTNQTKPRMQYICEVHCIK